MKNSEHKEMRQRMTFLERQVESTMAVRDYVFVRMYVCMYVCACVCLGDTVMMSFFFFAVVFADKMYIYKTIQQTNTQTTEELKRLRAQVEEFEAALESKRVMHDQVLQEMMKYKVG